MRLPALLLACFCAFGQQVQTPLPDGVFSIGGGVTAPVVTHKTDPEYAEEARIARLSGNILLSAVVGVDGKARGVHAARPLGLGLDEKAIEAFIAWQFNPGLKDGMPVPVLINVEINFRLVRARGVWSLARAAFNPPTGALRPVLTLAPYPPVYTANRRNGSVTISFDVNPNGAAENLHIEKSSDPALESEAIGILRGWQFRPGTKDGQPISVPCTLEFVEGEDPHPVR